MRSTNNSIIGREKNSLESKSNDPSDHSSYSKNINLFSCAH